MSIKRTILITGTSRGVGRALAEKMAQSGHMVIGCSRSACDFEHDNYCHVEADIEVEQQVRNLVDLISADGRKLEVLINNAGSKIDSLALLAARAQAQQMAEANFLGPMVLTREALKLMKRGRFGRVINFTSVAVPLNSPGTSLYGAAKAAMEQFSRTAAAEVGRDDITINTIGISVFEESAMVEVIDEAALKAARSKLIKPASLDIAQIAHAVNFFVSDMAANVTGQTLYFGGVR